MTRTVFAVDVTTTMISLARFQETEDGSVSKPSIAWVQPTAQSHFSPYSEWHHATTCAENVTGKILKNGKPDLVVIASSFWGSCATDPSANRRFRTYHMIEDGLFTAKVPVAEFPFTTTARWLLGYTPRKGRSGVMAELEKAVAAEWDTKKPEYETKAGDMRAYPFRTPVVALAAVAAMSVGIQTQVEVTDARLALINDKDNNASRWPADLKLPKNIASWNALHASPNLLRPAT